MSIGMPMDTPTSSVDHFAHVNGSCRSSESQAAHEELLSEAVQVLGPKSYINMRIRVWYITYGVEFLVYSI